MAGEGTLPKVFARRDAKGVPGFGVVALAAVAGLFAVLGTLSLIAEFASLTFLLVVGVIGLVAASLLDYLAGRRPGELFALAAIYAVLGLGAGYYALKSRATGSPR